MSTGNKNPKRIDLLGQKFGRWTVLEFVGIDKRRSAKWKCQCECGKIKIVTADSLIGGKSRSCGCLTSEKTKERIRHGDARRDGRSKLYMVWSGMIQRCNNPNSSGFHNYGGRGIKVFKPWLKYENFKEWAMEYGYFEGCNIDRINPDGDYSPDNCRFVKPVINANNRRNNHLLTYNNQTMTIAEWARVLSIKPTTIYNRLARGKTIEEALADVKSGSIRAI